MRGVILNMNGENNQSREEFFSMYWPNALAVRSTIRGISPLKIFWSCFFALSRPKHDARCHARITFKERLYIRSIQAYRITSYKRLSITCQSRPNASQVI